MKISFFPSRQLDLRIQGLFIISSVVLFFSGETVGFPLLAALALLLLIPLGFYNMIFSVLPSLFYSYQNKHEGRNRFFMTLRLLYLFSILPYAIAALYFSEQGDYYFIVFSFILPIFYALTNFGICLYEYKSQKSA
ncbi:hypothetical protein [Hugenholtzia roseola]|uniref:hypothetical protein n=1 Tax=Hugenholtzia roseola TaxID=1002 RepID=UPI0012B625D1|nr:hypothetical protein [Hugenholtzia roseola]